MLEYVSGRLLTIELRASLTPIRSIRWLLSVLRIRIRDWVPFWPLDPGWEKVSIRIRDEQLGSYFLELKNHFFLLFGVKILKLFDEDLGFGMETVWIRDGKKSDPGSGINIPDPPHWLLWWKEHSGHIYTLMAVMGSSRALARLVTVPITVSPAWKKRNLFHAKKNHHWMLKFFPLAQISISGKCKQWIINNCICLKPTTTSFNNK